MMGLAVSFTPNAGGNVQIMIVGDAGHTVALGSCQLQIAYGTSSAPANGAAATGTTLGGQIKATSATAAARVPFMLNGYVTGLAPGTPYWIDVQMDIVTAGTGNIADLDVLAVEL
jgi:hypothetical protein